jgi:hypothetical protein
MKTLTAVIAFGAGICLAPGQPVIPITHQPGVVQFQNFESPQVTSHLVTNLDGTLLVGTQYKAELYYLNTVTSSLTPIPASVLPFKTSTTQFPGEWLGSVTVGLPDGYGGVDLITYTGMEAGDGTGTGPGYYPVTLSVRVWDSSSGSSYETATVFGSSGNFVYTQRYSTPPAITDTQMLAQPGFQLVPEPSAIALCALGVAGLWFFRHRKND